MIKPIFYTGLKVLDSELKDKHITTMFSDFFLGKGKFSTTQEKGIAKVKEIVYWEKSGVTVALVDCPFAEQRHQFFSNMGFIYDLEWRPHVTLSHGHNDIDKFQYLIGLEFSVGEEYLKTMTKEV